MIHHFEKIPNRLSTILVVFDAGSRAEEGFPSGIAHMLEHMMFKGTKKRDWMQLARDIAFIGGETNAFTSEEMVGYHITAPYENIETAIEIISDMIFNSTFPEEEFLKERDVVAEEDLARLDQIYAYIWKYFSETYFDNHLAIPVIGDQDSIRSFTVDNVRDFHQKLYTPEHMLVVLAGNHDENDAHALLTDHFGVPDHDFLYSAPNNPCKSPATGPNRITKPSLMQSYVWIGYPGFDIYSPHRAGHLVLNEIFGSGMDSRLFTEVREKRGLCYGIGAMMDSYRDAGVFMITSSTQEGNVAEMIEVVDQEVQLIKTEPVTQEELQRAKNKIKAQTYGALEGSSSIAFTRMGEKFYGRDTLEELIEKVDAIDENDVMEVAGLIFDEDRKFTLLCENEEE